MRKVLFLPIVFMALHAFAQTPTPAPASGARPPMPGMDRPDFIVTLQMATDTLKNGQKMVKLTDESIAEMKQAMADPNYTVILTPRGDCGQLNLISTTPVGFVVKEEKGDNPSAMFDYLVVVKQKRPMMPMRPQRPGGQPGKPGQTPAQPGAPVQPGGATIQHN